MSLLSRRPEPSAALALSVGVNDMDAERAALSERRSAGSSLPPPMSATPPRPDAPLAWLVEAPVEDVLVGPDWVW